VAAADFRKNILAVQGKQPGLAVAEGDPQEQTPPARRDQDGGQRPAQGQGGGGARRKPGPGGGPQRQGGKSGPAMAASVQVRPMAAPAQMKKRHWGLLVSFLALVVAPLAATVFYLWVMAVDQYSSSTGFTVRQEETGGASDLLGGLAQFTGASTSSDSDVLYEFIQSQEIVRRIDDEIDLIGYYSTHWREDPVFSLWPGASLEGLLWYWQRVVRISYNQASGLIALEVLAFDPDTAQTIARSIVRESQAMINALNITAREDAMRYARNDLDESLARLKLARQALTNFRTRTQIVDPESDIQGRMGVLNNLQQQLAEALIEYDLLRNTANDNDPRTVQASRRIDVIRERIADERENFATADNSAELGGLAEDYPTLIAEFESLSVDREFAEETYRASLTALDAARANATRQSRYLATYIQPTMARSSQYPQRFTLSGLMALFLVLAWGIMALVYYSIRDRR